MLSLQNIDREHAFSESDQQLLETLAGSLSVALENARLVHETRQRNAELALINSVQDALAGELDHAGDLRRRRRPDPGIFDAQVVAIAMLDEATGLLQLPVHRSSAASGCQAEPTPLSGFSKHVLETREPLLLVEDIDAEAERYGSAVTAGEEPKSRALRPAGHRREGDRARSRCRTSIASTPSASPTSSCWRRWPAA